jgi:uncharacterized RDD family membrane protein YckC
VNEPLIPNTAEERQPATRITASTESIDPQQPSTYAGLVTRMIAALLDALLIAATVTITSRVGQIMLGFVSLDAQSCDRTHRLAQLQAYACHATSYVGPMTLVLLPPLYQILFWVAAGQTPGMALCGVQLHARSRGTLSLWSACVRLAGNWVSAATLGLGFIASMWDDERRTWADRLAGTHMVYTSTAVRARSKSLTVTTLVIGVLLSGYGCATVPKQTSLMKKMDVSLTSRELRTRVNELALTYSLTMQQTADEMRAAHPDPEIQRAALRWKIDSVGMGSMAFFRSDPLAAYLDSWLLTVQMRRYLESDAGRARFQSAATLGALGCRKVEAEFVRTLRSIGTPKQIQRTQPFIERWATEHPIQNHKLERQSIEPFLTAYAGAGSIGVMQAAGSVPEALQDASHQFKFYMWFMPKHATMEAELMAMDFRQSPEMKQALLTMLAFGELAQELKDTLHDARASFGEEKQSLLDYVSAERSGLMRDIDSQRITTLRHLQQERDVVLHALQQERKASMSDLDTIAQRAVDRGTQQAYAVIDHIFVRLAQAIAVLGTLVAIAWRWRSLRRQRQRRPERTPREKIAHNEPLQRASELS